MAQQLRLKMSRCSFWDVYLIMFLKSKTNILLLLVQPAATRAVRRLRDVKPVIKLIFSFCIQRGAFQMYNASK